MNKRLHLSFKEKLKHYAPALMMYGIILVLLIYFFWDKNYSVQSKSVRTLGEVLQGYAYLGVLATAVVFFKYRKLRFKEIPVSVTENVFEEAVNRTAKDRNWYLVKQNKNQYQYGTKPEFSTKRELLITIILERNHLLYNSIGSLVGRSSISLGIINKDRSVFLSHLRQVQAGQEYVKAPEINDTQWNWKMILARLFLYPLCAFFLWVSIFHLIPDGNYFFPIIIIAFALTYIFSDLYMIFKGEKTTSENE